MGPPNPAMYPAAHGTKHCHRYSPLPGVRNVKVVVVWSNDRSQGALLHGFFAVADMPSSGTARPTCGIENTCEARSGSIPCVVLPSSVMTPPTVPVGWPNQLLRSAEALSKL